MTGRLTPDFKTIANLRKDNGPAIRSVSRQFVLMCQQLGMFTEAVVAIYRARLECDPQKKCFYTVWTINGRSRPRCEAAVEQADFSAAVSQFAKAIIWKVESS